MRNTSALPASCRPTMKNAAPKTNPRTAPAKASPAAMRRVMRLSEPTRRSAASRRSRRSPPNRTAAAMNTATGMSSTTKTTRTSRSSTGSESSSPGTGSPNRSMRSTRPWEICSASPSAPR